MTMKQFSLFDTPPTSEELNFIKQCRSAALTLGLREVSPEEIENRCKRTEGNYNKLLKQLERKI